MKRWTTILIFLLSILPVFTILAQDEKINSGTREEVQRYIGYEPGTYKYITLPYDLTVGANVIGNYQDIGFILLVMVGIIFLGNPPKKLWKYALIVSGFFLYLSICLYYGKISVAENAFVDVASPDFEKAIEAAEFSWLDEFVSKVYILNANTLGPIYQSTEVIFKENDYLSIPLLCLLFLFAIYYSNRTFKSIGKTRSVQIAIVALACMGFYWLILSSGIMWYGFIVFVLAYLLLAGGFGKYSERAIWSRWIYLVPLMTAAILSVVFKTSNIYYEDDTPNFILDPSVWMYYSGNADKDFVYDSYNRNISIAINEINANPDLKVYKAGTSFNYLIDNSHERVFEDNLLGFWQGIERKYEYQEIDDVLKANGFGYLLVGLKTWTIDNTPEKTLQDKYKRFMRFIDNNNDLELIATDRVVRKQPGGDPVYDVAGSELLEYGYFAVFKL